MCIKVQFVLFHLFQICSTVNSKKPFPSSWFCVVFFKKKLWQTRGRFASVKDTPEGCIEFLTAWEKGVFLKALFSLSWVFLSQEFSIGPLCRRTPFWCRASGVAVLSLSSSGRSFALMDPIFALVCTMSSKALFRQLCALNIRFNLFDSTQTGTDEDVSVLSKSCDSSKSEYRIFLFCYYFVNISKNLSLCCPCEVLTVDWWGIKTFIFFSFSWDSISRNSENFKRAWILSVPSVSSLWCCLATGDMHVTHVQDQPMPH